jgi:hypothetical protein
MKSAVRSTVLAAALAALSCAAVANPITFEAAGNSAVTANAPFKIVSGIDGFLFSNAWAYKSPMFSAADVLPVVWDTGLTPIECKNSNGDLYPESECNSTGFIMNRTRGGLGQVLDIALDPTVHAGRFFTSLTLDLVHNAPTAKISLLNAAGTSRGDLMGFTNGGLIWQNNWSSNWAGDTTRADVTTLRFDFGTSALGLDNLSFTLSGTSGGTAPEPASYALVGLALLAAGAARRRKS